MKIVNGHKFYFNYIELPEYNFFEADELLPMLATKVLAHNPKCTIMRVRFAERRTREYRRNNNGNWFKVDGFNRKP